MSAKGTKNFHDSFDEETLLKLDIFRRYVREWIPVFFSSYSFPNVNIFDFFAGPGADSCGNLGSPLIDIEEISKYCSGSIVDPRINVLLYFNDKKKKNAELLRIRTQQVSKPPMPCNIVVDNLDFSEALEQSMHLIRDKKSANLIFLDQFGYKYITPDVFGDLVSCDATDVICFISSSFIKRFISIGNTQKYTGMKPEEFQNTLPSDVHRIICERYKGNSLKQVAYHVAPFSIKSQANMCGLIFGSRNLFGLEKFLRVCWEVDKITGEANFPIDNDPIARNPDQMPLFADDEITKKGKEFSTDLRNYLKQSERTNRDIYCFTLESGFLPKHTNELLKQMQNDNHLQVRGNGFAIRKGSYYISWEHYKKGIPKAFFNYK